MIVFNRDVIEQIGDKDEAINEIKELVRIRSEGGPNRIEEALEIARVWELGETWVKDTFVDAELALRELRTEEEAEAFRKKYEAQVEEAKKEEASFFGPAIQPKVEEPEAKVDEVPKEEEDEEEDERRYEEWNGVLDRDAPLDNARKLIGVRYWQRQGLMTKLRF